MALRLLGIKPGDEVIVPAYTYTASASVVCHIGAKPIFIDCQTGSFEMDYDQVEAAITEHTKAIIPVDLGGVPCDYDRIYDIANNKRDLFNPESEIQEDLGRVAIMADTAHAFGAKWHDKMVGCIADFSSFSFHAVKNLTTAEGGALTWRTLPSISNDEIYQKLQLMTLHGQSKSALEKSRKGSWEYDIVAPLYKCNMTDVTAAIGLVQIKRYGSMLKRRKEIIEYYDEKLKPLGIESLPHYTEKYQSSGHLYITRVPNINSDQRSEIITKMAEQGIACNVHYKPLPMMTAYKTLGYDISDFPRAFSHYENEITLPLHTQLTNEEIEYIATNYISCILDSGQ